MCIRLGFASYSLPLVNGAQPCTVSERMLRITLDRAAAVLSSWCSMPSRAQLPFGAMSLSRHLSSPCRWSSPLPFSSHLPFPDLLPQRLRMQALAGLTSLSSVLVHVSPFKHPRLELLISLSIYMDQVG